MASTSPHDLVVAVGEALVDDRQRLDAGGGEVAAPPLLLVDQAAAEVVEGREVVAEAAVAGLATGRSCSGASSRHCHVWIARQSDTAWRTLSARTRKM